MDFGEPNKLAFARRAAAALAYLGLAHLDRVSVAFLGEGHATSLRPLRGKGRVFEVFRFLSEPRSERLTGLAAAAHRVLGQRSPGRVHRRDQRDRAGHKMTIPVSALSPMASIARVLYFIPLCRATK